MCVWLELFIFTNHLFHTCLYLWLSHLSYLGYPQQSTTLASVNHSLHMTPSLNRNQALTGVGINQIGLGHNEITQAVISNDTSSVLEIFIGLESFHDITGLPPYQHHTMLYSGGDDDVQTAIINMYADFFELPADSLLGKIENVVTEK